MRAGSRYADTAPAKNIPVDFWYVTMAVNDHVIRALFDLGAGITLLNWPAAERLGVERRAATRKYGPPPEGLRDVLGKIAPAVVVKDVTITFPDRTWRKQEVLVSDAPVFEFFGMGEGLALSWTGPAQRQFLAIDFAGHQLYGARSTMRSSRRTDGEDQCPAAGSAFLHVVDRSCR